MSKSKQPSAASPGAPACAHPLWNILTGRCGVCGEYLGPPPAPSPSAGDAAPRKCMSCANVITGPVTWLPFCADCAGAPATRAPDPRDAAIEALVAHLDAVYPREDEGWSGHLDRIGMDFYRETGVWPHFKSAPLEMHLAPDEERLARWREWRSAQIDAAGNRARAAVRALAASAPETPGQGGNHGEG